MHQIRFRLGLLPRPRYGAHSAPRPLASSLIQGVLLLREGRGGKRGGRKGGEGVEGRKGEGVGGAGGRGRREKGRVASWLLGGQTLTLTSVQRSFKVMSTIASYSPSNISETIRDKGFVPKNHQQEMVYGKSNGYERPMTSRDTEDKLVTSIGHISRTAGDLKTIANFQIVCCEAVRSAILATARLLVLQRDARLRNAERGIPMVGICRLSVSL